MMKHKGKSNQWTIIALMVAILTVTYKAMAETDCNNNETLTGTVNDSVRVSAGDTCILSGATVNGDLIVDGGALQSFSSTMNGALSISASASGLTNSICNTTVTGKVEVTFTNAGSATYFGQLGGQCGDDVIAASIEFADNAGTVELVDAMVNGQVVFVRNTATAVVGDNVINGVLHCAVNTDISDGGLPNTVNNNVNSLQCAAF